MGANSVGVVHTCVVSSGSTHVARHVVSASVALGFGMTPNGYTRAGGSSGHDGACLQAVQCNGEAQKRIALCIQMHLRH